ncbi:hypothetical protein P389DRAFT_197073 [Cystobasidium minutum MCA 4210]|uniref:uncharacterized protein n=1 Tax=Cystobasidium minutum MCA 4210 TaxID=1397322 RepID=UPI0034CD0D4F|eukprot:jgi/Rhomi1/197073/gm1.5287_g
MQTSEQLFRACRASTSTLAASSRLFSSRGLATVAHSLRRSQSASSPPLQRQQPPQSLQWRPFSCSSSRLAEEVKGGMPFESNVMNLLANNEEFRKLVSDFAERMNEILGIDVHAGQMPSMSDMMRCAQDPQLRELSVKLTTILQKDGVNISPDTLKLLWSNMQGKGGQS